MTTTSAPPLVLHVLPRDLARGAQIFARELRDALDGEAVRHRTVTLFEAPPSVLRPDHKLDLRTGPLRKLGLDPRATLGLRRLFAETQPRVIVAHGGEPLKYCAASRPRDSKLVYHKIGISQSELSGLRLAAHRKLLKAADVVVAVSHDVADEARTHFRTDPDKTCVIPNGRDPERFRPADHDVDADVRLAFVGHMVPTKRPLHFVEVVRRAAAGRSDVAAVMAGDGPLLGEVRDAARGLPIEVLGRSDDVPAILARSSIFVFSSTPDGEGMPGVCIEAGLSALPVVATDVPGAGTVVEDGETGFVVPPADLDRLADRTLELVSDRALRRRMGAAARDRCLSRFTLDSAGRSWTRTLDSLL
jgi:glycosyltransferase involved in cell wall biosynthesis